MEGFIPKCETCQFLDKELTHNFGTDGYCKRHKVSVAYVCTCEEYRKK